MHLGVILDADLARESCNLLEIGVATEPDVKKELAAIPDAGVTTKPDLTRELDDIPELGLTIGAGYDDGFGPHAGAESDDRSVSGARAGPHTGFRHDRGDGQYMREGRASDGVRGGWPAHGDAPA
eukprot:2984359-Pyramimonas_sp.AAC.1